MGRKIPGKKHRGVRDPAKQQAARFENLKNKINAPPSQADEQFIPRSLSRIIDLKNKVKEGAFKKRKRDPKKAPQRRRPEKPFPVFKQNPEESNDEFLQRMDMVCESVMKETEFEEKFGVDVVRNDDTGDVEKVVKRKRDQLEKKEPKRNKRKKKKKTGEQEEPKLTKQQKRLEKLKEKKQRLIDAKFDGFREYEDKIKFGEVVNAPPELVRPRKVKVGEETQRPGKKPLLLKSLLKPQAATNNSKPGTKNVINKVPNKAIDKKGKRKNLPNALRRQLDKQQDEIIKAYKDLKGRKRKNEAQLQV